MSSRNKEAKESKYSCEACTSTRCIIKGKPQDDYCENNFTTALGSKIIDSETENKPSSDPEAEIKLSKAVSLLDLSVGKLLALYKDFNKIDKVMQFYESCLLGNCGDEAQQNAQAIEDNLTPADENQQTMMDDKTN